MRAERGAPGVGGSSSSIGGADVAPLRIARSAQVPSASWSRWPAARGAAWLGGPGASAMGRSAGAGLAWGWARERGEGGRGTGRLDELAWLALSIH